MKLDKYIKIGLFTNAYKEKMFSVEFNVPADSVGTYRGWKIKKAKKVAKMFKRLAEKLEKL